MTTDEKKPEPTAARTALWRALHVEVDAPPHVIVDTVGLQLLEPAADWRSRPDMKPEWTARFRASIVGRARFCDDLVIDEAAKGVSQYVILGAGLDSFAQRQIETAKRISIFEVDQPGPQAWKQERLAALGLSRPSHFVPVNFEETSWWDAIAAAGFDRDRPAIVVSLGVTMYLTAEANLETLATAARLAPGSTFVTTFIPPASELDPDDQTGMKFAMQGAKSAGTPFISFYRRDEIIGLATKAGLKHAQQASTAKYFAGRSDGLVASTGEQILVAKT